MTIYELNSMSGSERQMVNYMLLPISMSWFSTRISLTTI